MGNVLVSIIKVELIVMKVDFKFAGGNCVRQRLDKFFKKSHRVKHLSALLWWGDVFFLCFSVLLK